MKQQPFPLCRLCSSTNLVPVISEVHQGKIYNVMRCKDCDVTQTLEHYSDISPDYINLSDSEISNELLWCQGAHKLPAYKQWFSVAKKLTANKTPTLLDIGCGTGGFLEYAANNDFEVYGYDASRAQAKYANKIFINVRNAFEIEEYIKKLEKQDLSFDFITVWDVFEHIRNPELFLISTLRYLKPTGYIFISVPNSDAITWKKRIYSFFGKRPELTPWEHVFYYSVKSLKCFLEKNNYRALKTGAVVCYPRPLSLFEILRRIGFYFLSLFPPAAPQIYIWAKPSNNVKLH